MVELQAAQREQTKERIRIKEAGVVFAMIEPETSNRFVE